MIIKSLYITTCLLLAAVVFADLALVEEAIARMSEYKMEDYAYTLVRMEDGRETVEKYDPGIQDKIKWQLISRDGRTPTEKELKKYRSDKIKELKQQSKQAEENSQQGGPVTNADYSNFFDKNSLKLIEETDGYCLYSFKPADPAGSPAGKMMESFTGTLLINKTDRYIESMTMESPESFSPVFGVEIKKFFMKMDFIPLWEEGPVFLSWRNFVIEGSAFLIKSLDQHLEAAYSDYQYRGGDTGG